MGLEQQALFIFSALGAINGFMLSLYFAFFSKNKQRANYFLSALLFVLSVRIIKSVFFFFNPGLAEVFIQIGLSACVLIGPFLYLYITTTLNNRPRNGWLLHTLPVLLVIFFLGIIYPYWDYKILWSRWIVKIIYIQWFIYNILTLIQLRNLLRMLFLSRAQLKDIEIWMLSVFFGVTIIWIGYTIGSYTSYIVGALSFSFVFYLIVLLWLFKKNKNTLFFEEKIKYENKRIHAEEIQSIIAKLTVIKEDKLFKNSDLKLSDLAKQLNIQSYQLSQLLNDNLGKSFSLFMNEFRIEEAKELLVSSNAYTIESIGYDCGFNSKSTFFTTFKKITGTTPAKYKKENCKKESK